MNNVAESTSKLGFVIFAVEEREGHSPLSKNAVSSRCGGNGRCDRCGQGRCGPR